MRRYHHTIEGINPIHPGGVLRVKDHKRGSSGRLDRIIALLDRLAGDR